MASSTDRHPAVRWAGRVAAYLVVWFLLAALLGAAIFFGSTREVSLASHESELQPTLTGQLVVDTGPVLPDVRTDSGRRLGVDIRLGKTDAPTTGALIERYAVLASNPDGIEERIRQAMGDLVVDSVVRGLLLGAVPLLGWWLVGPTRRRELARDLVRTRDGVVLVMAVALLAAGLTLPWGAAEEHPEGDWISLDTFLGGQVPIPAELADVELRGDVTTQQTRRLVASAIDTYEKSHGFYAAAVEAAAELEPELRQPEEGETVVALTSDRHDNVGMDPVARAIGDAAGATGVLNAGDDTSTGSTWEGFSLDSMTAAWRDLDRWTVTGNHDHGEFVGDYLLDQGWQVLEGEKAVGPGGGVIFGVPDPRSSGLGNWRDATEGMTFAELTSWVADEVCDAETRVNTLLVHDHNLGDEALERGCVDLVVAGHLHLQVGPEPVTGENGEIGYSYVNGTTGGAAYAIAMGSKLRRAAQVTLVTYDEDGVPAGLQAVILETNGRFRVGEYDELEGLREEDATTPDEGATTPEEEPTETVTPEE